MDEEKEGIDIATWTEVHIMSEANNPLVIYRAGEEMIVNIDSSDVALAETFHEAMQKKGDGYGTATYLINKFKLATIYGYRLLWGQFVKLNNIEIREVTKTSFVKKVKFDHGE